MPLSSTDITKNNCSNEVASTSSSKTPSWLARQFQAIKTYFSPTAASLEARKKAFMDLLTKSLYTTITLKQMCNQVFSLLSGSSMIVLFPRMDFRGMGYIPQFFFIYPKRNLLSATINTNTSDKPIVNFQTRKMEYASYNIDVKPMTFSLTNALLSSAYKKIVDAFKAFEPTISQQFFEIMGSDASTSGNFFNSLLQNDINLIRYQLMERVQSGVYFSVFSPAIGFHETAVITNLTTSNSTYLYCVDINVTIKIVKTFNIPEYQNFSISQFYQA